MHLVMKINLKNCCDLERTKVIECVLQLLQDMTIFFKQRTRILPFLLRIQFSCFFFIKFNISTYRNLSTMWIIQLIVFGSGTIANENVYLTPIIKLFFCSILVCEHKLCSQIPLGVWFLVSFHSMTPVESSSIGFWLDSDSECRHHSLQLQPWKLWPSVYALTCFSSCSDLFEFSSQPLYFARTSIMLLKSVKSLVLHMKLQISLMWILLLYQT